jgi:uncharacterized membrane protein
MRPTFVRLALAAVVAACAVMYSLEGLVRHWAFGSSYDLAIYDQAVWHFSRFEIPASSIRGYSNLFGDHFHPVLILFAPLYWVWSSPSALLVAQGVLFGLSIVPVFLFARGRVGDAAGLLIAGAYGLFWGLQHAAAFDVHEFAFAPLFVATAILAMERRQWRLFSVALVAVALTKEDLLPLVAWFGAYLWWTGHRRRGLTVMVMGLLAFAVVVGFLIPYLGAQDNFGYSSAYAAVVQQPWRIPEGLVSPPTKLYTALMWLGPFAFLSLASPLVVLAIPLVLVRFLSSSPLHWGTAFHYTAPLAPILAMAAADGVARVVEKMRSESARPRRRLIAAAACLVLASLLPGHQRHWRLITPAFYRAAPQAAGARHALSLVPASASVVAHAAVLSHLSERHRAYVLRPGAPDADYVVSASGLSPWPMQNEVELHDLLAERRARGYRVLIDQDGWTVLKR